MKLIKDLFIKDLFIKDLFEVAESHDNKILPGLVYMPYIIQESSTVIISGNPLPKVGIKSRYSVANINTDYLTF